MVLSLPNTMWQQDFTKIVFAYRSMFRSADRQQHIGVVLKLVSQMVRLFLPSTHAGHCLDISSDSDFWSMICYAMVSDSLKGDGNWSCLPQSCCSDGRLSRAPLYINDCLVWSDSFRNGSLYS